MDANTLEHYYLSLFTIQTPSYNNQKLHPTPLLSFRNSAGEENEHQSQSR